MDSSNQQKQTREFFETFAEQWSRNAKSNNADFVNIIKIRNNYVEEACKKYLQKNARTLDVGCGTGDLVISLNKIGYDSSGIDFTFSMIEQAKKDAKTAEIDTNKFTHISFFDYKPKSKFNLISANGFIEYISEKQFEEFIANSYDYLEKGGILVFESRNRIFNCFSFNTYTEAEIQLNEINNLLEECIIFNNAKDINQILSSNFQPKITKNLEKHELTGDKYAHITVDVRYQYTPFQLIRILEKNGFSVLDLYPVHIHAITTGAKQKSPEVHTQLSYHLLEQKNLHLQLIPQSSSIMITARKNE